jgi:ATP synthase protein I
MMEILLKDKGALNGAAQGLFPASGPSATPWLNILKKCLLIASAATAVLAVAALVVSGWAGVGSVAFGAVVVVAFFGLSLLVGHIYGRKNPSGAIGVFMVTYLVKVVGFAVILFTLGAPTWLNGPWFAAAGVVVVVLWQATEVVTFSRQRLLLYNDPAEPQAPTGSPGETK